MKRSTYAHLFVASALLGVGSAASASVDRSPPPRGVYPLKPGIYVAKGTTCGDALNASIRKYDGLGISDAHSHACRAKIISRRFGKFVADQSCIDAGVGLAPRVTERHTVSVRDALTFTVSRGGQGTTYRYCPAYMLPKGVR